MTMCTRWIQYSTVTNDDVHTLDTIQHCNWWRYSHNGYNTSLRMMTMFTYWIKYITVNLQIFVSLLLMFTLIWLYLCGKVMIENVKHIWHQFNFYLNIVIFCSFIMYVNLVKFFFSLTQTLYASECKALWTAMRRSTQQ